MQIKDPSPKELDEIRTSFTYRDKKVQYELHRHRQNTWLRSKSPAAWEARQEDLKTREKVCLVTEKDGLITTHSGLTNLLESKYSVKAKLDYTFPEGSMLPWVKLPEFEPHPYQTKAKEALLVRKHARVEMGTGLGKSFIIMLLVRQLGLKTVVMAPSQSIADQLFRDFEAHLGKRYVGKFYDGKKEPKKLIVVGTAQSLTRIEPGSECWELLSKTQVFVADESHQCPASTLANVCFGVLASAPWRFFFSATQMRNDGLDLLLDAITGPTVFSMTVREGVDQGFLAKPVFKMIETQSDKHYESDDANEMTREHLYKNSRVLQQVASMANLSVSKLGHQVLILIDEVEQFTRLLPMLKHPVQFAHGPLQATQYHPGQEHLPIEHRKVKVKGNIDQVPMVYRDSNPNDLVRRFNAGEYPILVGTSCISTGTDLKSPKTMIYFKGGKSEIEVKQGVGRVTRLAKGIGKTACTVIDFDVTNVQVLTKHAMAREEIYNDIYGPVERVKW